MSIAPRSSFSARRPRRVPTVAAAGFASAGTSLVDAIPALADLAAPLDAQGVYGALFATVFVWRTVEMTSGLATNAE